MKTERRHELQQNELAARLTILIEKIKPHSSSIMLGVIVLLVVTIGITWFSNQSAETSSEAWSSYFRASERGIFEATDDEEVKEKLEKTAKEFSGSDVEDWALLGAANEEFQIASTKLPTSREEGRQHFTVAASQYRNLLDKSSIAEVINRAAFNLAITYENLEDIDKAREAYDKVGGSLREIAQQRSEELDKADIRKFYDWYAKAEMKSPLIPDSLPGSPGKRPEFDVEDPLKSPLGLGAENDPSANPGDVKLPSFLDGVEPSGKPGDAAGLPKEGRPPEPPAEGASAEPAKGPDLEQKPATESPTESPAKPAVKEEAAEPKPE